MPAVQFYPLVHNDPTAPYLSGQSVTPHDTNELNAICRGIYVGGAGNVTIVTPSGDTLTFTAVPVGTILPVYARIIKATGTTATNLLALW